MTEGVTRVRRAGSGLAIGLLIAVVAGSAAASAKPAPTGTSSTSTTTTTRSGGTLGNTVIFSSGGGILTGSPSRRVGVRQAFGVTLRVYTATLPTPIGASGPSGPIPATCFPDRQIVVEYSTPDIAGTVAFQGRHDQPIAPQAQVVGVGEKHLTVVMTALVPANSQQVVMHFIGGHTDSAKPFAGGWVALTSPLTSVPAIYRHPVPLLTDRPGPLGTLSVIDHRGHSHSLGSVTANGGFPASLGTCLNRGPTPVPAPPLALPQPTGPPPADQAGARQSIEAAYHRLFEASANTTDPGDLQGPQALSDAERKHLQQAYGDITGKLKVRVNDFRFLSPTEAALSFDLLLNGQPITATTVGRAVLDNGQWKVARATFCEVVGRGGIQCL